MASISRRKVLSVATAAGVVAFLPSRLAAAILPSRVAPNGSAIPPTQSATLLLASDLLAVSHVSDPSSASRLNDLFPGLLADAGFQQFLPAAFLVTNIGVRDIRAFQCRWTITTPNGQGEIITKNFLRPYAGRYRRQLMPWGVKGDDKYFTGKIPVIRAGATRLVTPYFCWNATSYKRPDRLSWEILLRLRSRPEIVLSDLSKPGTSVAMTIDAAILHDCSSVGPNDEDLAMVFCVTRNAEHDEAVAINNARLLGQSQEQLIDQLRRDAIGLEFQGNSSLYYRVRQRHANVLLSEIDRVSWNRFLDTLDYLRSQPKSRWQRVQSVAR